MKSDQIPYAFGGAIALAYYRQPRATADIDVNIFVPSEQHEPVFRSLSSLFPIRESEQEIRKLRETGWTQLTWDQTHVDLFFADDDFNNSMAERTRKVAFGETEIPIISAEDLIVCKTSFDRPKDWVDIEEMFKEQRQNLDERYIKRWLNEFFEPRETRMERIEGLVRRYSRPSNPERM